MQQLKLNFSLFVIVCFSVVTFISCDNKPSQKELPNDALLTRSDKNIEHLEREYDKAKLYGIKKRQSFPFFYTNGEEKAGKLVEEIFFDQNGNRIRQIKYADGDIDYDFVFEFNENNKIHSMKSFNIDSTLLIEKKYLYDDEGKNTGINEIDHFSPRNTKYHHFTYQDSLLVERQIDNVNFNNIVDEKLVYDSLGYKIAEYKSDPNGIILPTFYEHDGYGNITKIKTPIYELLFTFDSRGNVITQELISDSTRQYKYVYEYDSDGLLLNFKRYDNLENMIFKMEYKYEFY